MTGNFYLRVSASPCPRVNPNLSKSLWRTTSLRCLADDLIFAQFCLTFLILLVGRRLG
jgi:hypothetical protein